MDTTSLQQVTTYLRSLEPIAHVHPDYRGAAFYDADGTLIVATAKFCELMDISASDYRLLQTNRTYAQAFFYPNRSDRGRAITALGTLQES